MISASPDVLKLTPQLILHLGHIADIESNSIFKD